MRIATKTIKALIVISCLIFFVYFILNQYQLIIYPYQHEYREAAVIYVVSLMKAGINPYAAISQPEAVYVYGLGQPLLVYAFSFITPNLLFASRLSTTFAMLGSAVLIFFILKKRRIETPYILLAINIFLYEQTLFANLAFPNALAVFTMLLALFIAERSAFSVQGIFLSVFISVLGIIVKPYVFLTCIVIVTYTFLFIDYKRGIIASLLSLGCLLTFIFVVDGFFEAYFINTYYSFKGANISSFNHLKNQIDSFINDNIHYSLVAIVLLYQSLRLKNIETIKTSFIEAKTIYNFKNGILAYRPDIFLYAALTGFGAFIVKLGHHQGSCCGMYLYHIATPFLLIFLASSVEKLGNRYFLPVVLLMFSISFSIKMHTKYIDNFFSLKVLEFEVNKVKDKLKSYHNIYNSPEVVSIMVEKGAKIYNNGSTEYFKDALNISDYSKYELATNIQSEFVTKINLGIANQKFDLVLQTHNYFGFNYLNKQLLESKYELKEVVNYPMLLGNWDVEFWVRKKILISN